MGEMVWASTIRTSVAGPALSDLRIFATTLFLHSDPHNTPGRLRMNPSGRVLKLFLLTIAMTRFGTMARFGNGITADTDAQSVFAMLISGLIAMVIKLCLLKLDGAPP